jgi:N-methylhydantoinase A
MNAYTQPMFQAYVDRLERGLADLGFAGRFYVMTSGGGTVLPATARRYPVRMLESGPAAGVLLSAALGRRSARPRLLAFDMGGTTAKGALVRDGEVGKRYGLEVARIHEFKAGSGLPAMIPAVDLIEIGAGGGSLAAVDARGVIEAGPRSAGADPGPACYGRGGIAPTLTDANLLLGYLNADFFLGGAMALDRAAAERAIRHVADPLSVETVRAAWGVHETVNENVARAFRNHAAERGFDCRSSAMIAFGGSGPLHALRVARKLKVPEVVFPAAAGVMSAVGLLASPLAFDTLRSDAVMLDDLDADGFDRRFGGLAGEAVRPLHDAGIERTAIRVRRAVDARYRGQGYAIEVALPDGDGRDLVPDLPRLFAEAYAAVFAKSFPDEPVEVLNWKVAAAGPAPIADDAYRLSAPSGPSRIKGSRPAWCPEAGGFVDCPVYDRAALRPGDRFDGPALVEEAESTAILGFGDRAVVDAHGDLAVRVAVPGEAASGLKIAGAS